MFDSKNVIQNSVNKSVLIESDIFQIIFVKMSIEQVHLSHPVQKAEMKTNTIFNFQKAST